MAVARDENEPALRHSRSDYKIDRVVIRSQVIMQPRHKTL